MMLLPDRWGRFYRTLRYVPPHLWWLRLVFRAKQVYFASPLYNLDALVPQAERAEEAFHLLMVPPWFHQGDRQHGKAIAAGTLTLLKESVEVGKQVAWFPARRSALWVFNLHYHEWLADLKAAGEVQTARRLLASWMEECGAYHRVAWHPYPMSLRLVSWLVHAAWLLEGADAEFARSFQDMILRQSQCLRAGLEWHLGGENHLIKNLKALVYVGACVAGRQEYLVFGLAEVLRQLDRQLLPDGAHMERSPAYHAQVLEDLVDIAAVLKRVGGGVPPKLEDVIERMGAALAFYRYADGGLALFNDSETGDVAHLDRLVRASFSGDRPTVLPDAGYVRLERGKTLVLLDSGKIGPDENPGHAHADTLSFELSTGKERVVVNSGTYAYQHKLRTALRGTAAHSTVSVGSENSAEVWGGFRVGRRPQHVTLQVKDTGSGDMVAEGSHDGYRHLRVVHRRRMVVSGDGSMVQGEDELVGRVGARHRVMAHFHLHPGIKVTLLSDSEARLETPSGKLWGLQVKGGRLDVRDSMYAPCFGEMHSSKQLVVHGRLERGMCRLHWRFVGQQG